MKQLLEARQQAKRLARSSNQTMIQALNNNPLKFAPTAEDAMRIMFGPQTRSYLDARGALAQSFDDLKAHQVRTFSAMQHALKLVLEEFDPDIIEARIKGRSRPCRRCRVAQGSACGTSMWRAGRPARRTMRTACSMPSWIILPNCYDRDGNNVR